MMAVALLPSPQLEVAVPEGDTVYLAAKRMTAALSGRRLTRGELRHPRLAEHDLSGLTILGVHNPSWAYTTWASTCSPASMTDEACIRISGWTAPGTFTDPGSVGDGQAIKPGQC
jgi:hypothetical protein